MDYSLILSFSHFIRSIDKNMTNMMNHTVAVPVIKELINYSYQGDVNRVKDIIEKYPHYINEMNRVRTNNNPIS